MQDNCLTNKYLNDIIILINPSINISKYCSQAQ